MSRRAGAPFGGPAKSGIFNAYFRDSLPVFCSFEPHLRQFIVFYTRTCSIHIDIEPEYKKGDDVKHMR